MNDCSWFVKKSIFTDRLPSGNLNLAGAGAMARVKGHLRRKKCYQAGIRELSPGDNFKESPTATNRSTGVYLPVPALPDS
jgi:hypothetical protein